MADPTTIMSFDATGTATISSATASCTTAVPGKYGAVPTDACNSYYLFEPSWGGNIAFAVLFGVTTLGHFIQMFIFKKWYCWVVVMGAAWEVIAFSVRAVAAHNQQSLTHVVIGTLFLLLAPLWINAFIFMSLARLIYFVLPEQRVWNIKAIWMTKLFVGLDIISFIVQAAGGSMLSQDDEPDIVKIGQKVYMGGIAFQAAFIVGFIAINIAFFLKLRNLDPYNTDIKRTKILVIELTVCLCLIMIRIIYRLVEFGEPPSKDNTLLQSEAYPFFLDGLPMLLALLLLNLTHPGFTLKGPGSEFPKLTRHEKKQIKRAKKEEKRAKKAAKKAGSKAYFVNETLVSDGDYEMATRSSPV